MAQADDSGPAEFMQGLLLAERYFREVVEPLVDQAVPGMRYAAALVGDGSDVLGYDTPISADHDWGPRVLLFLSPRDFERHADRLLNCLDAGLQATFRGWPTHFPDPDRPDRLNLAEGAAGSDHGVELHTLAGWTSRQLGADLSVGSPTRSQWEGFAEDHLLSMTAGAVFRDDNGELSALRQRIASWPEPLRLAKMAALWSGAAAEMPFVGRAGDCGDELGSRLIAGRLVELAMRLCFLLDGRYAPYSKWFGTAFGRLPSGAVVQPDLERALGAEDWREREAALGRAFLRIAELHRERGLGGEFEPRLGPYFTRPYTVINADEIGGAIAAAARERLAEHEI